MKSENWKDSLAALRATMDFSDISEMPETQADHEQPQKQAQTERLDIMLDRKGRAGKTATIIAGFTIGDEEVAALATGLKRSLGTGGSARGGEILIQGDRRTDIDSFLRSHGFKTRII